MHLAGLPSGATKHGARGKRQGLGYLSAQEVELLAAPLADSPGKGCLNRGDVIRQVVACTITRTSRVSSGWQQIIKHHGGLVLKGFARLHVVNALLTHMLCVVAADAVKPCDWETGSLMRSNHPGM